MSRNRVPGDSCTPTIIPTTAAPGVYNEKVTDDFVVVNSGQAAGTPAITVVMNGVATGGVAPSDGDEVTIADVFGVLGAGTTLVIDGNGKRIANGAALANTVTYNTAATRVRLVFCLAADGGAGAWLRV